MSAITFDKPVKVSIDQLIAHFNTKIEAAEELRSPARSSRLQLEQCSALDQLMLQATEIKHQAIARKDENTANLFLGFQCAIGVVRSELMMWILLKRDKPNEAWDRYVAARMACMDAIRAHIGFAHCEQRLDVLNEIEKSIFPPQVFMSLGFFADRLDCSICGERYAKCGHLRGKPYMGFFCEVIHRNPRGDHVATVKVPSDRRCRVVSFKTKEGHRDKLSLEITPYAEGECFSDDGQLEVHATILALDRYPYLAPSTEILGTGPEANATAVA